MALEIEHRDFRTPDELYVVERGRIEVVRIRGGSLRRFLLEPGWRSDGGASDLGFGGPQLLYHAAGRIRFGAPRGQVLEAGPGQVVGLPPGSRHELGALAFAVALRRRGIGVLYLGADVPISGWRNAMSDPRRRLAIISVATDADRPAAEDVVASLGELHGRLLIATGGRASLPAEPLGEGVVSLPDRIGEAAAAAARLLASARRA